VGCCPARSKAAAVRTVDPQTAWFYRAESTVLRSGCCSFDLANKTPDSRPSQQPDMAATGSTLCCVMTSNLWDKALSVCHTCSCASPATATLSAVCSCLTLRKKLRHSSSQPHACIDAGPSRPSQVSKAFVCKRSCSKHWSCAGVRSYTHSGSPKQRAQQPHAAAADTQLEAPATVQHIPQHMPVAFSAAASCQLSHTRPDNLVSHLQQAFPSLP
jgi:hypothetical protein